MAVRGPVIEDLPYCTGSLLPLRTLLPQVGTGRRSLHWAQGCHGINNSHLDGDPTTVPRALCCSHIFLLADSGPQMCLVWPSHSVFKILNQLPTFSVQEIYVKMQTWLSTVVPGLVRAVAFTLWESLAWKCPDARNEEKCNSGTAQCRQKQVDAFIAPLPDSCRTMTALGWQGVG